jgi:hypothetical protein
LNESNGLVVITNGTCGDGNATVANDTWTYVRSNYTSNDTLRADYTFGTPLVGVPGGHYVLCWAHHPRTNPRDLRDYNVQVDPSADLAGPNTRLLECTLGIKCSVALEGYRLGTTNRIVVITNGTCGQENATIDSATWVGVNATDVSNTSANYTFGTPTVGLAGSHYRLCWSHNASNVRDYNVEIDSSADLAGPFVRHLDCTLGLECALTLEGHRLSASNRLAVISSGACGDSNASIANATWTTQNATNVSNASANYTFETPTIGTAGAYFKLCWGHDPVSMSNYNVELDPSAVLAGPFVTDFSCTLGLLCTLEVFGYRVNSSNAMILLAHGSCGSASATIANVTFNRSSAIVGLTLMYVQSEVDVEIELPLASLGYSYEVQPAGRSNKRGSASGGSWYDDPGPSILTDGQAPSVVQSTSAIDRYAVQGRPTFDLGGFYVITEVAASYVVQAGVAKYPIASLTLEGVSIDGSTEMIEWTTGWPYSGDGGYTHRFDPGFTECVNSVVIAKLVSTQDGVVSQASALLTEFALRGIPCVAVDSDIIQNTSYTWGMPLVGDPGGSYKLCWGHDPNVTEDYKFEVDGGAELVGPFTRDLDCTLGLQCAVVLTGYRLAASNAIVALYNSSCGDANATVMSATWNRTAANAIAGTSETNGTNATFDLGTPVVGLAGNAYTLCWGHNPMNLSDFNVEVDPSADLDGPFVIDFQCMLGYPCAPVITGYGLATTNGMVVISHGECGENTATIANETFVGMVNTTGVGNGPDGNGTNSTYNFSTPIAGVAGFFYKLCWAHDPRSLADFKVEVDGFGELFGPYATDLECTLGQRCTLVLEGYGMADTNQLVVLTNSSCGAADAAVSNETWSNVTANCIGFVCETSNSSYDFGTPLVGTPGSFYRLCWSYNPTSLGDYKFEVDGSAELAGPFTRDFECTLGVACSVVISGYKLAATDAVVALSSGTCGNASAAYNNDTWRIERVAELASNGSNASFDFATPLVGTPGLFYRLCWGHNATALEDFKVELDPMAELVGPFTRNFECTLGIACAVVLEGYRMNLSNGLVVIDSADPCGAAGNISNETWDREAPTAIGSSDQNGTNASYNFSTPVRGLAGLSYRLCWGWNPVNVSDFNVQIDADVELVGPFVRDLDCTLGILCAVNLTGYRLNVSNAIVAITNGSCGDAASVVAPDTWDIANASVVATRALGGIFDNASYAFGTPLLGVAGSFYQLCWAHRYSSDLSDFKVQIDDAAELRGPYVANYSCIMGLSCTLIITGFGMEPTNEIVAVNGSCGNSTEVANLTWTRTNGSVNSNGTNATYTFGSPVFGEPGDQYRLCWGHEPVGLTDFNFEIDPTYGLIGPARGNYSCTIGEPCTAQIVGFGLNESNMMLMGAFGKCGEPELMVSSLYFPVTGVSSDGTTANFSLGTVNFGFIGDMYKLCWAWDPRTQQKLDYRVTVDPDFELALSRARRLRGQGSSSFTWGYANESV